MEKYKKNILPFLILTLLTSLFVGFRSFLMDYIVEPIALLFWAVWRIISSVDQNLYWIALIVICTLLVIRLIPSEKDNSPSPAYIYKYKPPNRVEYWQTLIDESVRGKNKNEYLRYRMQELTMTILSQVEQPAITEADEVMTTEALSLSPAARQYLFPLNKKDRVSSFKDQLSNDVVVPRWLRRWRRKNIQQYNTILDEILKWMETELEINNEG
jgi:type IV secretory pathway VirB3-like protein